MWWPLLAVSILLLGKRIGRGIIVQTSEKGSVREYFENIYNAIRTVSLGLKITMRAYLKTNGLVKRQGGYNYGTGDVTIQYPEQKDPLPKGTRNRLFNHVEACISCNQCAVICPVECISIESRKKESHENLEERTPAAFGSKPIKLKLLRFDIDEALCCFCGLCTEVCPTECLVHTEEFEYSKYDRDHLSYNYLEFRDDNPLPKG